MENILVALIIISIIAILAVSVFIYYQMEATKQFVRDELSKFATLVNDAQYNEFTFDKMTEGNIKTIDKKLKDIGEQLKNLQAQSKTLKTKATKDIK